MTVLQRGLPRAEDQAGVQTAPTERLLAEVLAEVLEVEEVPATADFFDELGADSLVMAHFCARLSRRSDLPSVSIKEVYQHPTIRSLATAVSGASPESDPAPASLPPPPTIEEAAPVGRFQYGLCGAMQLLALFEFSALAAIVAARGFDWVSAGSGVISTYQRSAVFAAGVFVAWSAIGIMAKWALFGRWKPERFRIWSLRYVAFWFVKVLLQSNPMRVFVGTPIYVLFLRALGAKIGRNVVVLSANLPVCADLLTIGDGTVVRKDSLFTCYRARGGLIETGPVLLGANAFVGEATVLDIHTALGDGAQLGHASALFSGQSIPDGERRVGSPARQSTDVDYRGVGSTDNAARRRITYSIAQLVILFAVTLPLPTSLAVALAELRISPTGLFSSGQPLGSWTFFREALIFSLALFLIVTIFRLVVVLTVPRLLKRVIQPGTTYPLFGIRYWAHRAIGRVSNVRFFTTLFGDSSYIVHYLHLLGYDVSFEEQTGANFGMNVKHDNPFNVTVGAGTMAADGLSIINADYSSTSFRVSPATIGAHSFLGNQVAYPSQSRVGEDCLCASKVMVPMDGDRREHVGFLGSPSFEIPRLVLRDRKFDHLKRPDERARRLVAKNRHNVVTMGLFLLVRWFALFGAALLLLSTADFYQRFGPATVLVISILATVFGTLYFVIIERASTGFKPLRPLYCSIYERESWQIERFWKLSWQPAFFNGTPLKGLLWRLLGVGVGRRLFDDGALMIEKTMITLGDDCTLNVASVIQPHSQEDGSFKSDRVTIGDRCTLGVGSLVHYGVTMGDGATLAPNAFLMKGADVRPNTHWGENPARELGADRPDQQPTAAEPDSRTAGEIETTTGGESPAMAKTETGQEYWRRVVQAGGRTAIPRWTVGPRVDDHRSAIADDLLASLERAAGDLEVSFSSILLAAHAKVLAALAGERDVITGYVAEEAGSPLICRLTTEPESWRALVLETHRTESELLSHRQVSVDAVSKELGLSAPVYETALDPTGVCNVGEDLVMAVGVLRHAGENVLRLRYRVDVLDAEAAARIAGYHLVALDRIACDVDGAHRRQSLLSDEELRHQLDGLAGPHRELPDHRFHELFEQRVQAHPDRVAVVHGHRPWTYRQLNARANQLGRALLTRGLGPEDVVAVVTERNPDWMAAVLAIFKAGGVYLPIEPHFPADRIAATMSRAECRLTVTEPGSRATLDEALQSLAGVRTLSIDAAYGEGHADDDLGIAVAPDQLAYIYFTSGSTGEPKGAMCEHTGMLNHLLAKIEDLEIGEGQTVAQIAPQCFDISLWQLVSALLVGGRTVLIDQDTILDPQRFVDTIVDGRVGVMQVVPSYLEVLLSYLEQDPRDLPELHCVSVTGEALTLELAQRWFETMPGVKLANAYGLTETSDDTNHEVMDRAPEGGGVPLGRAINNVEVRVVDENLSPVPLGAPGEIVFSGICVGRGYINDLERTRQAYLPDPLRPGRRLYRSGDYGRWRPDGKLEFLGRRDAQVKIRGFRIEIGEIENAIQSVPGIRHGAVVVTGSDQNKQLVGFYSGQRFEVDALTDRLSRSLPDYMVPMVLHWRETLPLTDNGKVDRKALLALATEPAATDRKVAAPATPAEQRLAAAWARVLEVREDEIGRHDDFFDRGGTSLSAVELVIALDGAVSLKDIGRAPVLAELAALIDGGPGPRSGLLQLLAPSDDPAAGALVCFPYAGGNAINYQAMARALRGRGPAVHAVELPGHDVASPGEDFAPFTRVVDQVVAEILQLDLAPILLWGHSSGAAFALETAVRLQAAGADVQRVVLAAQLLGDPAQRRSHVAELESRSDADLATSLRARTGHAELGELNRTHASQIGAAYRHDCQSAHRYLLDAMESPPAQKLSAPVTVVVAADDPATAGWSDRYRDWELFADRVVVHELADGGHYFLRTRPEEAAEVAIRAVEHPGGSDRSGSSGPPPTSTSTSTPTSTPMPTSTPSLLGVDSGSTQPPMVHPAANGRASSWAADHRDELRDLVTEHGSVLVRGLDLGGVDGVGSVAGALTADLVIEREAFASRQVHPGGLYSSSEWPPNQQMCMHHELSYRLEFPALMIFACLAAPDDGGAIALADAPAVLDSLPSDLVERFDREGWILTRNYTEEVGLSVADAFGTDDRREVDRYCRANAIEVEWQLDGGLRTRQRRRAVVDHPTTGRRCWFNQIAFLSRWTMNPEVREYLTDLYGADGLPFDTRFGNGDPIDEEVVQVINQTYEAHSRRQALQDGDLLLVDNIRTAHSREPYEGRRQVLVALGEPTRIADLAPDHEWSIGF